MKQAALENLEIRVRSTGKGWRVDTHEIGAVETRTVARMPKKTEAVESAQSLATSLRKHGRYGFVRLTVELLEGETE